MPSMWPMSRRAKITLRCSIPERILPLSRWGGKAASRVAAQEPISFPLNVVPRSPRKLLAQDTANNKTATSRGVMDKDEYPPLLAAGFHSMSLQELRKLCVDRFPTSKRRGQVMDGLEKVLLKISAIGLKAEAWVDGSFLTEKLEPDDSDVVVRVTGADSALADPAQEEVMNWINDTDLKPDYYCDGYCFVEYESTHPLGGVGEWSRAYWIRQFGFSRKDEFKGIALIKLPLSS